MIVAVFHVVVYTRYLYGETGEADLRWESRRQLLLQELKEAKADVSVYSTPLLCVSCSSLPPSLPPSLIAGSVSAGGGGATLP